MSKWRPGKEYERITTDLHRLRNSRKLLQHTCYRWMHYPALDLISAQIKELEAQQQILLGIEEEQI